MKPPFSEWRVFRLHSKDYVQSSDSIARTLFRLLRNQPRQYHRFWEHPQTDTEDVRICFEFGDAYCIPDTPVADRPLWQGSLSDSNTCNTQYFTTFLPPFLILTSELSPWSHSSCLVCSCVDPTVLRQLCCLPA